MNSYVWWLANRGLQYGSAFLAAHPVETSLAIAGLSNPATRGFVWRVLSGFVDNTARYMLQNFLTVGRAAIAESTFAARTWAGMQGVGRFVARHPIGVVAVVDVAAVALAVELSKHEDPLTESLQVRSVSHAAGGTGQPSIGSGGSWLIGAGGFSI